MRILRKADTGGHPLRLRGRTDDSARSPAGDEGTAASRTRPEEESAPFHTADGPAPDGHNRRRRRRIPHLPRPQRHLGQLPTRPFIRIENLYSSDCKTQIPLIKLDESTDLIKQQCKKEYPSFLNIDGHYALKVVMKGNGILSKDAICIRLSSLGGTDGYADYVVKTNFDGWKELILSDLDNAEYPDLKFQGMDDQLYKIHRFSTNYTRISSLQIYTAGECNGVRIKSIEAVPLTPNALVNPSVVMGNNSITFLDSLQSGEFVEYQVGNETATIYDSIGNARNTMVEREGRFLVSNGKFSVFVHGIPELRNAPSEVVLTFGFYGDYIAN